MVHYFLFWRLGQSGRGSARGVYSARLMRVEFRVKGFRAHEVELGAVLADCTFSSIAS